ncbi:MAG: FAD-dependent oxidoreductase [Planctomycetota bacterium]
MWLETERFDERGGWTVDAQFIDQMGSPYLMAVGLGEPVEDAVTTVTLPRGGRYRLWARTNDWTPEHHPGRFGILLAGRPVDHAFGQNGKTGWQWEDGGVHELSGKVEVRLDDLTGYYGRCDVLVFSDDPRWTPPADLETLAAVRERHGGVSREVEAMGPYDVVVVGGGLAGSTAAVAAARNGARTALIQNRPLLGGNASTEILVPPVGVTPGVYRAHYPLDPRETGLVEEYRTAGDQRVREGKLYSERLLRFVRLEPNLDLYLNTHATGVEMEPGSVQRTQGIQRIAAVLAMDVHSGRRMRFPGKIIIDSTGDAVIGVAAGAQYRHGKESRSEHNEPWAPEVASRHTMGNGLKYFPERTDSPQPFEAPPWIYKFPACDDFTPGRHPPLPTSTAIGYQWKFELGGLRDTYADGEEIRDDLLRLIHGLWDHTKNHCPQYREKAAAYKLAWVGHVMGKRENRRLIGDYVLTQNDIGEQTLFADRVAFGAWIVDDHHPAGFFHQGSFGTHYDDPEHAYQGVPYSIPFRCLYSRNVENLMMAGRNISVSHLALANTRVMLTCAVIGHAAGTGAAACIQKNTTPRGIMENHISELQQQLSKEGAHLIELRADDPRDLARRAKPTASSHRTGPGGDVMGAANVTNGYARAVGEGIAATTNAWAADPRAPAPHWIELAWDGPVSWNVVHVTFQTAELAPEQFALEAWVEGAWQPLAGVSDNRHRRHVLGLERTTASKLRLVLDEPAAVCEVRVYDEPQRLVEIARRAHENMRLADVGPWLPFPEGGAVLALPGIVLDCSEGERTGYWSESTWSERFVGDGYLHDGDTQKGAKSIRFTPNLPRAGKYEVRIAYAAFDNRATNTPVTIHASGGPETVRINQRVEPPIDGMFLSLGTFHFDAGGTARVEITNAGTDGYVVVDAMQWLPVSEDATGQADR